jgi:hypothetical protein
MAALALGAVAACAVIYAATGWLDGFGPEAWALKRRFLRRLPWLLLAAAPVGVLLTRMHRASLDPRPEAVRGGWWLLLAIPRIFLHFPFYGLILLFQVIWILLKLAAQKLWSRFAGRPGSSQALQAWLEEAFLLRFMVGSVVHLSGDADAERDTFHQGRLRETLRFLGYLPILLAALFLWTGATGEDSGERVDPWLLALVATVWLGDFLLVFLLKLTRPSAPEG